MAHDGAHPPGTMSRLPGDLRLEILGDLLRNPGTDIAGLGQRVEVTDPQVLRITLRRLAGRGWVHAMSQGRFMLSAAGRAYVGQVRTWLGTHPKD